MGETIRVIVSSACNAFRSDGYTRSTISYRKLGETAQIVQTKRRIALDKNIKITNARTSKLGK